MVVVFKNNAKLGKLLITSVLFFIFSQNQFAQETDPISEAIRKDNQAYEGMSITTKEQKELDRINSKYSISERQKQLRLDRESGKKMGLFKKYRLGRANRKDYLWKKKMEKFNHDLILNRQNEATKNRMLENEKKIKKRDKKIKHKERRKRFFNLFK
jgi:hypothetical protein